VKTGDVRGAATDSAAFLSIFGNLGSTGAKRLNASAGSFDRGASCEATVSGFDVGEMTHVVISLDGSGLLSSWYLDELEVEHIGTGQLLCFKVARCVTEGALRFPPARGCSVQHVCTAAATNTQQPLTLSFAHTEVQADSCCLQS
jgi:hypothetical protein